MKNLTRSARGAAVALLLALVAAAPAAADPPTRVVHGLSVFTLDPDTACAFGVRGEPAWGFIAKTTYSDGRVEHSVRAHGAYVNVDTGTRYPTADNFRDLSRIDPTTGYTLGVEGGQTRWSFLPGDIGPYGVVGAHGAMYHFVGNLSYTYDLVNNHTRQFAYKGTVEDVCAALD